MQKLWLTKVEYLSKSMQTMHTSEETKIKINPSSYWMQNKKNINIIVSLYENFPPVWCGASVYQDLHSYLLCMDVSHSHWIESNGWELRWPFNFMKSNTETWSWFKIIMKLERNFWILCLRCSQLLWFFLLFSLLPTFSSSNG